jgi:hypothetical protein
MLKKFWPYLLIFGGLFGVLAFFGDGKKQDVKWYKTYKQKDKIPFGSNALYRLLESEAFSGKMQVKKLPILQSPGIKNSTGVSYFFLNDQLFFDQYETRKLIDFVKRGNKVFLSANFFSGSMKDTFGIETRADLPYINENTGEVDTSDARSFGLNYLNPYLKNKSKYVYDHLLGYSTFSAFDTAKLAVVAADDSGRAVMLRTKMDKGEIYFFSLPDVFSNYYIVKHPSRFFAYKAVSFLSNEELWWDEYYKTFNAPDQNPFRLVVDNDSLYFAFWMAILATLFFMFFGMKREQRPIPIIKPKENSTLQFVEVVGNVYFGAQNHKVIAEEKITVFLEFIRSKFQVKTEQVTEDDIKRISRLSGIDVQRIQEVFANIRYIYLSEHLSEAELMHFNRRIENFYKSNKR